MGEYAQRRSDGERVKIGTCEDMYYLRADQRHLVDVETGNVNVNSDDVYALRFRFPWPDEDGTAPGDFERFSRAVAVDGATPPPDTDHHTVQFSAPAGYLLGLPCPEGTYNPHIARNAFQGAVQLVQQKLLRDGRLVPVCRCGGCEAAWRVEDSSEIEALAVAFRAMGDRKEQLGRHNGTGAADRSWYDQVADRILAGARLTLSLVGEI